MKIFVKENRKIFRIIGAIPSALIYHMATLIFDFEYVFAVALGLLIIQILAFVSLVLSYL